MLVQYEQSPSIILNRWNVHFLSVVIIAFIDMRRKSELRQIIGYHSLHSKFYEATCSMFNSARCQAIHPDLGPIKVFYGIKRPKVGNILFPPNTISQYRLPRALRFELLMKSYEVRCFN